MEAIVATFAKHLSKLDKVIRLEAFEYYYKGTRTTEYRRKTNRVWTALTVTKLPFAHFTESERVSCHSRGITLDE
eukprot:3448961-Amphidinium_carterae.1